MKSRYHFLLWPSQILGLYSIQTKPKQKGEQLKPSNDTVHEEYLFFWQHYRCLSMHYYVKRWLLFFRSRIHSSAVCSYIEVIRYPRINNSIFPVVIPFPIQFPPLNNTRELSFSFELELKANRMCLLQIQSSWGTVYLAVIKQMAFHISFKGYQH